MQQQFEQLADKYASQFGIDQGLFRRLVTQESAWNPNAKSHVGAQGLTQVMPDTARQPGFGVTPLSNPLDPEENLRFGAEYFSKMLARYEGDVPKALAAYNWGAGNADKWDGNLDSLPEETRGYIGKIHVNEQPSQGALSQGQGMLSPVAPPSPVTAAPLDGDPNNTLFQAAAQQTGPAPTGVPFAESQGFGPVVGPNAMPIDALTGGLNDAVGRADTSPPEASQESPEDGEGWFNQIFGSNGKVVNAMGWQDLSQEQRDDRWLALGTGLLSQDNWADGLAAGGQGVLGLRQQERENARRDQALSQRSSGGTYNRPFNIVGRDRETGEDVVKQGIMRDGIAHVVQDDGSIVPAASVYRDVRIGGRSEKQDVVAGAGNIPNAVSVNADGLPSFSFQRESDGKAYSWGVRAIAAEQDLTAMIDHYGPETFTSLTAGLQQWASQNARESITPAAINSILDDSGVQGSARSAMAQFLQAVLRSDTGAAYTGVEIADYAGAFLPNPGDDPEAVAYKRNARMDAIRGIVPRAGAAAPYLGGVLDGTYKLPGERWSPPQDEGGGPDPDAGPAPEGVDPEVWKFLTPEQRKLWN